MTTDEAALRRQQQLKRVVIPLLVAVLFAVLFWPAKETTPPPPPAAPVAASPAGAASSEVTTARPWPRWNLEHITAENPFLPPETKTESESGSATADSASPVARDAGPVASEEAAEGALSWWQMAQDMTRLVDRLRQPAPAVATSGTSWTSPGTAASESAAVAASDHAVDDDAADEHSHTVSVEQLDPESVGRLQAILHSEHGRIALLEGNRLIREGDRLAEGYRVVQITPDEILVRPSEPRVGSSGPRVGPSEPAGPGGGPAEL
ncbi:hypothetical protein [Roseimaritima sediminicola]|uniref:hypothetical protein n=1 Tax=Roseimaritima sediminicola TaxID=2662066 RepID=UPI00129847CE|nr:hypothetical protein [Roseimaritima sediminicola]